MKRDLTVILLCFVAAAGGANVQPILTGAGKLVFPENATSAYLSASSGALTVAAGGTNKGVFLVPTGTGKVGISPSAFTPSALLHVYKSSGDVLAKIESGDTGSTAAYQVWKRNTTAAGAEYWAGTGLNTATEWSLYDATSGAFRIVVLQNGNVGVKGVTAPSYAVDAGGDVNATGVFRKGGTSGLSSTITIRNSAGTGTCTVTFSGGIVTATTC